MKYIRLFEQDKKPENEFWKVRTDTPYYEISLDKMGMTEDEKEYFLYDREMYFKRKHIYIGLEWEGIGSNYYYGIDMNAFSTGYKYSGEIEDEITQEDIEKWIFENDINKYNL